MNETLNSLFAIDTNEINQIEILIIDNDPRFSAREIVSKYFNKVTLSVKYINEDRIGLSHARNRGISESKGEIVFFLDDDVIVNKTWLIEMLRVFDEKDAICVGGRVIVKWVEVPEYPIHECEKELIALDKGDTDQMFSGRSTPIGANIAFRSCVFNQGLRFSTKLGHSGDGQISGEETEMIWQLQRQNKPIWYSAKGIVYHQFSGERCKKIYYIRQYYWFGVSYTMIDKEIDNLAICIIIGVLRISKAIILDLPKWILFRIIRNRPASFLLSCKIAKAIGYWNGILFDKRERHDDIIMQLYRFLNV